MSMEKIYAELEGNYGTKGYNCAEMTARSFATVKDLQIPEPAFRLLGGFGGGMYTGGACGAVTGGIAILGYMYRVDSGHDSPELKEKVLLFSKLVEERLGGLDCRYLRPKYATEEKGCRPVIWQISEILEEVCLTKVEIPEV